MGLGLTMLALGSSPSRKGDRTLKVIEKLKQEREIRRKSAEEFKKRRAVEIRDNEKRGRPGDVDFQRMILQYRWNLEKALPHESVGPLKINVVVRKRPVSQQEVDKKDYDSVTCSNPVVHVHHCKYKVDGITKYLDTTKFAVDHAFGEDASNADVYQHTARELVEFALSGGRATCFAYGQTGSGKTYTMAGVQGIAARDIFHLLKLKKYAGRQLKVCVAFFELYGGRCIDLLHGRNTCMVREDGKGRVQIEGLHEVIVNHMDELLELIEQGNGDRTTHATEMNNVSSRSHAICQIAFREQNSYEKEPFGKLSLIDLAGSERGQDTKQHNKQRRAESAEINKSLLALKECIRALGNSGNGAPTRHVPYRVSKLTMVLKDSFSSDAKTVMISCVSPAASSSDHTLNTLRYAHRVKEKKASRPRSKARAKQRRRQTLNFASSRSAHAITREDKFSESLRTESSTTNSVNGPGSTLATRTSDPVKREPEVDLDESYDLRMEIDQAIEKYESEQVRLTSPPEESENVMKYGNTVSSSSGEKLSRSLELDSYSVERTETFGSDLMQSSLPRKQGKHKPRPKKRLSQWGDAVKTASVQQPRHRTQPSKKSILQSPHVAASSKENDKDLDSFANMSFKDLVSKLVDEEDELLNSHLSSIERNAKMLSEESQLLEKVKAQEVVDYDIDEYTSKLDQILVDRIDMYNALHRKLTVFRKHLDMEGVRA